MNFDWGNFLTTLFATGFGAWGAYCFNLKQARNQEKEIEKIHKQDEKRQENLVRNYANVQDEDGQFKLDLASDNERQQKQEKLKASASFLFLTS